MTTAIRRDVEDALSQEDLNEAVRLLKQGLRREPYWEWGHRVLGDIYLKGIDHSSYALVEYRKLRQTADTFAPADKLRLIWAYLERGFEDKALEVLKDLDDDELPETIDILKENYDTKQLLDKFTRQIDTTVEEESEEFFEKYRRDGTEHRRAGNMYQAQQAFEKALDYCQDPTTKLDLARCLIQRSKYPEALEYLKSIQDTDEVAEDVDELITDVYQRLGLHDLFKDKQDHDDRDENASRKAS
ncbi:MAG: tetratricopeptide repeat protein [bacterium]